jgi:hypothetical protein
MRWNDRRLVTGLWLLPLFAVAPVVAEEPPAPAIDVRVADGTVIVDAQDAAVADVLRAIGDRTHVSVTVSGRLDSLVTRSFVAPSVEDAVRRLARGHSTVWTYVPSRTTPGAHELTEIIVFAAAPATVERISTQERAARR